MENTSNPDDFDLRIKGITGASDRGWEAPSSSSKPKQRFA